MLVVAFLSVLSTFMILEALERAKALRLQSSMSIGDYNDDDRDKLLQLETRGRSQGSNTSTLREGYVKVDDDQEIVDNYDDNLSFSSRNEDALAKTSKMELPELCDIFLGPSGRNAYCAAIAVYIYGTLTAYCTVFAQSLSSHVPIFDSLQSNYDMYLALFFVCVVPLSCRELEEQIE